MGKSLHLKFCKKIFDFLVALGKATLCVITIGELLHATTYHDRRTLNDFLKIGLKAPGISLSSLRYHGLL
jgi:hypothetical protein